MKAFVQFLVLFLQPLAFMGQGAPASNPRPENAAVPVALGQSVIALLGPWRFHTGDDPRWADPSVDDSHWETVDLTPIPQTTVPGMPIPGFVSGSSPQP